jgi:hypothetical protein
LQFARGLLSHSLIRDTAEPTQIEEFRPEFAQWQFIASYATYDKRPVAAENVNIFRYFVFILN